MSQEQGCCGGHLNTYQTPVGNTSDSQPKDYTYKLIDQNIFNLFKSITRLEGVLDGLEGGASILKPDQKQEVPPNVSVVSVYKQAPDKIAIATERIHLLIDRLEDQFS